MTFSIDKPMGNIHINMDGGQPTEKEIDATITKMEKIIKKKKGNYKNMDLLENIYEDDYDNNGGILESLQDFEKELNNLNDSLKEVSQEGFDNNETFDGKLYDYKNDYENIITPGSILTGSSSSSSNSGSGSSKKNKSKPAGYIRKQNRLGLLEKWFGTIPYKKYYEKWIGKPLVQKKSSKKSKIKCKTASAAKYIDEGISYVRCIINIPSLLFWFLAAYMYDSFDRDSKKPAKNGDDVILVATQIWHVFIIPLIVFITYNWYYLMFMVDSKGAPIESVFPEKVMNTVKLSFFTKLFKSLVKPMILSDVFLRWTVQYLWRITATTFKTIKF
jgi:hypothetical protein